MTGDDDGGPGVPSGPASAGFRGCVHQGSVGDGNPVTELWSLRADVVIDDEPDESVLRLHSPWGEAVVRSAGPVVREVLHRMQLGPTRLENALDSARKPASAAAADRAAVRGVLSRIQPLVVRSLATSTGDLVLLSVEPIAASARFHPRPPAAGLPIRLSAFTALRASDGILQAESPLSLHRVLLHRDEAAAVGSALAQPRTLDDLAELLPTEQNLLRAVVAYLLASGVAVQAVEGPVGPVFAEDTDPVLRLWPPGDLMFHTRSSLGRHDGPFGAAHAHGPGPGPEPAVKPPPAGEPIALYRPRFEQILESDAPFSAVLEARRSPHRFAAEGPDVRELGELLYRALRIRAQTKPAEADPAEADSPTEVLLNRPYPAGGALHELEFYLTVRDCPGLKPGVYAYDALRHVLYPVDDRAAARGPLLRQAQAATGLAAPPPVLITVTARFGRVLWKYSGLGYSLVLKDAGVALLTLQLVATAMGLGARPVGGAEINRVPALLGLDWRAESGVGALVLGRPAAAADPDPANQGSDSFPDDDPLDTLVSVNDAHWRRLAEGVINS